MDGKDELKMIRETNWLVIINNEEDYLKRWEGMNGFVLFFLKKIILF